MAIREIIVEGDARLRKRSREVENIKDPRVQQLIDDMIDTLYDCGNGIGLAAVQVGMLKRIFIIDLMEGDGLRVYINPEFVLREGVQRGQEGCLSLPDHWGMVDRAAKVTIRAYDRNGEIFERTATKLEAVCMCHEMGHLEGQLFADIAIGEVIKA